MLPKIGEIYQSKNTQRCFYIMGHKRNRNKYAQSEYDVCLLCTEKHIYSEIPFDWFTSIYEKIQEAQPLPELEVITYYRQRLTLENIHNEPDYSRYL